MPVGGGIRVRLLRPAEPSRVLDGPAGEDPAAVIVGFFDESLNGPTGCRRVRAGPARSGVEASRSAWSAGSWWRRVRLPVGLGDGPGRIVPAPDLPGRPGRLAGASSPPRPG
ncbi:hypothetical protein EGX94_07075 [Propionibacterium acidifaciens]|nr:hypothetical protein EGX94_07075 [Propionibacterium acidifaciens]